MTRLSEGFGGFRWGLVLLAAGVLSCGDPESPEARIRAMLEQAETAAETKDIATLNELVAADYGDDRGQDRRAVRQLLAVYLLRHESIHLLTRVRDITVSEGGGRATATVAVGMTGLPVTGPEELGSRRADMYRFTLELSEQGGEWQVKRANWQPAELSDFL